MIRQTTDLPRSRALNRVLDDYYRVLAGRLRQVVVGDGLAARSVGVTSTKLHEGVTAATMNLAIAEATSSGRRVLLIDAHSAQPTLSRIFGYGRMKGALNVLAGAESLEGAVRPTGAAPTLSILPAGRLAAGQSTRRALAHVEILLDAAEQQFDLVLCDLPPVSVGSGCLDWASSLGGVALMIEAERVKAATARAAVQLLNRAGAELLGVILNKDPTQKVQWRRKPR